LADFKSVIQRLLDRQVLYRHENQKEAEIYDRYLRIEDLIQEYLSIMGITVVGNERLNFVIAYPPGSDIPGVNCEIPEDMAMQRRIRADEAGLIITLRLLYEEKLREGELSDNGCVYVPLETVYTRFLGITKKEMPSSESDRKALFSTLRQLRIIEYKEINESGQWIGIREIILNFTLDGVAAAISDAEKDYKEEEVL
jgi:hypothetical protein